MVVERKRRSDELDRFVWFCESCNNPLYEAVVRFDDPSEAVTRATGAMKADEKLRTCGNCGAVLTL